LAVMRAACQSAVRKSATAKISEENRTTMPAALQNIKARCEEIGLTLSAKSAERGLELMKNP
jgi:enamine deaminase RidA (YjgF/YER057c/UK114 family)